MDSDIFGRRIPENIYISTFAELSGPWGQWEYYYGADADDGSRHFLYCLDHPQHYTLRNIALHRRGGLGTSDMCQTTLCPYNLSEISCIVKLCWNKLSAQHVWVAIKFAPAVRCQIFNKFQNWRKKKWHGGHVGHGGHGHGGHIQVTDLPSPIWRSYILIWRYNL